MKLYFSPGACSRAPHIALREAGLKFDTEKVDLKAKKTKSGADYLTVNPKGAVPALALDEGGVLTEVSVVLQYIADRKPESKLAPPAGTLERYRLQEWLNFIATELHKGFGTFFNPKASDEWKQALRDKLGAQLDYLSRALQGRSYLLGETFTVADAYLFNILGWAGFAKVDLSKWPAITAYVERVGARPAVKATLEAESAA
jgi:glutathione S-transferase